MSFVMTCWVPLRYLVDTHPLTLLKSTETQISKRDRIIGFLFFVVGSLMILFLLTKKLVFSIIIIIIFIFLAFLFYYVITRLFRRIYTYAQKWRSSHF
jgi:predicted lysophospholipase L1 biosynthesis ABC-type transport system permease subunit